MYRGLAPNVVRNAAYHDDQYNNGHTNADDPASINSAYSEIHHNGTVKYFYRNKIIST